MAGQAGGTLVHTISVLQADLLKDADVVGGVAPAEIEI